MVHTTGCVCLALLHQQSFVAHIDHGTTVHNLGSKAHIKFCEKGINRSTVILCLDNMDSLQTSFTRREAIPVARIIVG